MPTRLFLIRHAESRHKIDGATGGARTCKGLTETGRWQAARLRDRLAREPGVAAPVPLYASVIPRAVEMAQALDDPPVIQDCGLCTWHIPPAGDGMAVTEFQRRFAVPGGGVFQPFEEGNESWAELVGRAGRTLAGIARRHRDRTTVVVTHAEVVEASLIVFGHLPLLRAFDVRVSNASLTEWTTDGDPAAWPPARWTLVRFNDAAHLDAG